VKGRATAARAGTALLILRVNSQRGVLQRVRGRNRLMRATALLKISSAHEDFQICFGRNFLAVRWGSD
jgi:hypothetical protein